MAGEPLRFLSVCSGIEAASVAWGPLGWQAVAFSEIEKFPSAVLAHHYPDVPNLGDLTQIDTTTLGQVDILCGGTPCQAFSVAGLRQSLDDARGNLSLEFVRLAHELADGNGLRNVVWENVVGVLSTKDNAFGCFLGGLVGADTPIEPPARGKWPSAGLVSGPKGRAAWRIVDAQYFGVAQRRRRVLVVADFGNGADPAQVLFELEGVQRHTAPSREAGKGFAATISARTKGGGGLGTDFDLDGGLVESAAPVAFVQNIRDEVRLMNGDGQIVGALAAEPGAKQQCYLAQTVTYAPEIARCDATREGSSQDYETTTMVASFRVAGDGAAYDEGDRSAPLTTGTDPNAHVIAQTVAIRGREGGATAELGGEVATALRASSGGGDKPHVLAAVAFQSSQSGVRVGEVHATLDSNNGSRRHNGAIVGSAVRRLTPRECERLQGFQFLCAPDYPGAWQDDAGRWWSPDYTAIPWRGKPASECPDGPRYKALGNSWAVPKFVWLGRRIAMHMPASIAILEAV
ncbi:hypothetical protein A3840_08820 [Devosia elaeis]|uniref:DNA (cytosine-5-)-methyltransferase n=1 Tax=Devosia elaeis TaxID=1770058 RepID=A0A178HYB6_9HYPH|nr:hypothetical protein A3840_08820 [Devosia elaeis]